jgi:3-phenylpropionate/trans-cinnamate dioxygenase ferredoxin component
MSWLSDKLMGLIKQRELTADKIARDLAIERSRLTNIVNGSALPNESLTKRLANYFGEDPSEWLSNIAKPNEVAKDAAAIPSDFFKIAKVSEILEGEMKVVFHDLVAIANIGNDFYAFGNICPHAAGPLGEGYLEGRAVECPWHSAQWDITTGKPVSGLATTDIPLFELRVVGDDIEIKLTEAVHKQGEIGSINA